MPAIASPLLPDREPCYAAVMAKSSMTTAVLIVAAGRGSRFGGDGPKQYATLAGQPLLRWAAEAFLAHPAVSSVCCVIHRDDGATYAAATAGLALAAPVIGGATRQASVRHGLEALAALAEPPDQVLVHDAARPLLFSGVIDRVLNALQSTMVQFLRCRFLIRLSGLDRISVSLRLCPAPTSGVRRPRRGSGLQTSWPPIAPRRMMTLRTMPICYRPPAISGFG